jgi:methylmalonyl-CoA/ethylmalonyl-CoA epimerase
MPDLRYNEACFHHIGVACRSIDSEAARYASLGYRAEGRCFHDERQGVSGVFLVGGGPRLELLEPLNGSDTLEPWLKGGARMYHMAYACKHFEAYSNDLRSAGAKCVKSALPAVAFNGAPVAFYMMPNRMLIEVVGIDAEFKSMFTGHGGDRPS